MCSMNTTGEAQTWRTLQFSRGSNPGSLKSLKLKSRTWKYYETHSTAKLESTKILHMKDEQQKGNEGIPLRR